MSGMEELFSQLREQAEERGQDWLQGVLGPVLERPTGVIPAAGTSGGRARRSRPPDRFSPERFAPSARQGGGSAGVQAGPPAKRSAGRAAGSPVRIPGQTSRPALERGGASGAAARPSRTCGRGNTRPAPASATRGSGPSPGRGDARVPRPSGSAAGGGRVEDQAEEGSSGAEAGRAEVPSTGPGKAVQKSVGGYATRRRDRMAADPAAAVAVMPCRPGLDEEMSDGPLSVGELVESEEEEPPPRRVAAVESRRSAGGAAPAQSGKFNLPLSVGDVSGDVGQGSQAGLVAPVVGGAIGGNVGMLAFLDGIKALVQTFETAERSRAGPAAAWVPPAGLGATETGGVGAPSGSSAASVAVPAVVSPAPVVPQGSGKVSTGESAGRQDIIRLADAAKCEVYLCYEGPLGSHLKPEVREKLWKGEYVDIFSLLPLEQFNLDRVKPDDSKKEDEEKRRYRLIPRTFTNWLQAFGIMASVIGEKHPECCSALFCYQGSIAEAHRVYGGSGWLRYDEQFRQRRAVRPDLRWDHKDITVWMRLMTAPRGQNQFFQGGAGGPSAQGQSAGNKKGVCWQYNSGTCKFGSSCRYKHECSGCGGSHAGSKCFKQGRGKTGDSGNKREDAGEGGKDAAVPR